MEWPYTTLPVKNVVCCSARSTWRQPLFRFYLDACWKFSEQSFSLESACRMKHNSFFSIVQKNTMIFSLLASIENCIWMWLLFAHEWRRTQCLPPGSVSSISHQMLSLRLQRAAWRKRFRYECKSSHIWMQFCGQPRKLKLCSFLQDRGERICFNLHADLRLKDCSENFQHASK